MQVVYTLTPSTETGTYVDVICTDPFTRSCHCDSLVPSLFRMISMTSDSDWFSPELMVMTASEQALTRNRRPLSVSRMPVTFGRGSRVSCPSPAVKKVIGSTTLPSLFVHSVKLGTQYQRTSVTARVYLQTRHQRQQESYYALWAQRWWKLL